GRGVGKSPLFEERGVGCRAEPSPRPFRRVEDEIRAVALEPGGGAARRPAHLDTLDAVSEPLQRGGERLDGLACIELRLVFRISEAEVVRQGDSHAMWSSCRAAREASGAVAGARFVTGRASSPRATRPSITCVP